MVTLRRCLSWIHGFCGAHVFSRRKYKEKDGVKPQMTKLAEQSSSESEIETTESLKEIVETVIRDFELTDDDIRRCAQGFIIQMNEGLIKDGCTIEQLPSFVSNIPVGNEKGTYLAVDLGGTNVRVCSVTLNGDGSYNLIQEKSMIPAELLTSDSSKPLFHWVAQMVGNLLKTHFAEDLARVAANPEEMGPIFNLGFTFSHAVSQIGINSGTLIRWSKGFDIGGSVGQDICVLLQDAFNELSLPIRVAALINDTVGTLLAQAYASPKSSKTVLGAVFGTGTNGAYIEQVSNITKLIRSDAGTNGTMVINTEWGNFDQKLEYIPTTTYDTTIDADSVNPGFELFEKRISGMYLGEILRLVILSLYQNPKIDLFGGLPVPEASALTTRWSLDCSFMSHLENDTTPDLSGCRKEIEQRLGIAQISLEVAQVIRGIAKAIARRSARLSAVALGAVIVQTDCLKHIAAGEERVNIGVDGSLIELYPGFVTEIKRGLRCIEEIGVEGEARIDIVIAKDGSGVGAALAAYSATCA